MEIILIPVAVTTTEKTELIMIPTATKAILRTTITTTSEMVDVRKVKIKNKNLVFFLLFRYFLSFCFLSSKMKIAIQHIRWLIFCCHSISLDKHFCLSTKFF